MACSRPIITKREVKQLLFEYFGISETMEIKELSAYEDRNFHIRVGDPEARQFIFKVTTSAKSISNLEFMQHHVDLMSHLTQEGFCVPQTIRSKNGESLRWAEVGGSRHVVRLFHFIEGEVMAKSSPTDSDFYKTVGEFCGKLTVALQKFPPTEVFASCSCEWHLEEVLTTAKGYIENDIPLEKQSLFEQIFNDFDETVVAHMDSFETGLIHSDLNENNIIVNGSCEVVGVIDFNEVTVSPLVFDLAIAIFHAMAHAKTLTAGKYVLEGYLMHKKLPKRDLHVLNHCVKARLCQCLVLCAHALTLDGDNEYLSKTSEHYWTILDELVDKDIFTLWDYSVSDSDATHS